jgi:bifunctional non-homologous end joining protein LigD
MAQRTRYRPELATLVDAPPAGPGWIHELKFDGYRIGAFLEARKVRLESRREIDWTAKFPEVVAVVERLRCDSALFDGEVAITLPDGKTSFQALQNSFKGGSRAGLTYYVFDLLELNGTSLTSLPLEQRKDVLRRLVGADSGLVRYSEHFEVEGATLLERVCKLGGEGIISKKRDAKHRPSRSENWLKTKCVKRQEFVIGGFTEPEGSRAGVGGILLGVYEAGKLVYAGKVGTGKGFNNTYLEEMRRVFDTIKRVECPYSVKPTREQAGKPHWVEPVLVCEVQFVEWTADGSIRHPSFLGFRDDKRPQEVTREAPHASK